MAGTSNRCELVGFATGHFVYISFAIHGSYCRNGSTVNKG